MGKTAEQKHLDFVRDKVTKAIYDYELIEEGDKILVGVSGGKDSLVLLEALALKQKYFPIKFELHAIHIDVVNVPYQLDIDFIKALCDRLEVPFHHIELEVDFNFKPKKTKCFACSWFRRKNIFAFTKEHGFTKIALGHHRDDALETLMMNMAYHGSICSMPAKLRMFDGLFHMIRPLIYLENRHMQEYAEIQNFVGLKSECPFEDKTKRQIAANILKEFEQLHPAYKKNLFNSMSKIDHEYLPVKPQ